MNPQVGDIEQEEDIDNQNLESEKEEEPSSNKMNEETNRKKEPMIPQPVGQTQVENHMEPNTCGYKWVHESLDSDREGTPKQLEGGIGKELQIILKKKNASVWQKVTAKKGKRGKVRVQGIP